MQPLKPQTNKKQIMNYENQTKDLWFGGGQQRQRSLSSGMLFE